MKNKIKKSFPLYLILLPALIYVFIFNYIPMYGVQIAFRDFSVKRGIWGSEWVGLEYFIKFVNHPDFIKLMKNTLVVGLYVLATFPCSIIFALLLNEVKNLKYKKTVQMISYVPHFISTVVVTSMLLLFFDLDTGVINSVIEKLGGNAQDFMSVPEYFPHLYAWSGVWQSLGFSSIIYLSALSGVPRELIEAAEIDGASRLQIIRHVNLPCILPTIVIMLILSCGNLLNVGFEKVFLMQNSLNLSTSRIISTYTYEIGLLGGEFSYSTAIGLFNNIINIAIMCVVNRFAKKMSGTGIW